MKRKAIIPLLITGALLFGCEPPVPDTSEEVLSTAPTVTTNTDISTESDTSSSLTTIPTSEIKPTTISKPALTTTITISTVTIEKATEIAIPSGFDFDSIPSFSDSPYCEVNNNVPFFDASDYTTESYEFYSPLDDLGRCGVCMASIGSDLMPTGARGEIGSVRPTGFQLVRYDDIIADKYLFNRCHII